MLVDKDLIKKLSYEWINGDNSQYKRMEWLFHNSKKHRVRTKNLNKLKKIYPKYKLFQMIEDNLVIHFQKEESNKFIGDISKEVSKWQKENIKYHFEKNL